MLQRMKMMILILSPRATGAVGPALSWECPFVLERDSVTLLSFPRSLSTLDPWRASQGTPRPANTSREKDTKFCSQHIFVLSARHDQAKTRDATRRRLCAASVPSSALRFFSFQLPRKGSIHLRHTSLLSTSLSKASSDAVRTLARAESLLIKHEECRVSRGQMHMLGRKTTPCIDSRCARTVRTCPIVASTAPLLWTE